MTHLTRSAAGCAPFLLWTTMVLGQSSPPAPQPADKQPAPAVERTAVTVNGHQITEREVETTCDAVLKEQMQGRPVPPDQLAQFRTRLRPQILDRLISNLLLDDDVTKAQISVAEGDLVQELEELLRAHLLRTGTTRADFEKRIQEQMGKPFKEFMATRAADPKFKQSVLHRRLLEKKYPTELVVTDEDIKTRYEASRDREFSKPEMVQASHVLIGTEATATPEEKAAARTKADNVLAEAKKPGADFAALAAEHSTCPSRSRGGDLGAFPRNGAMVEPFAAAAFALKLGEISEVVETRFGFHVIKLTDRKPATVVSLEQASDGIREQLRMEKTGNLLERHVAELKKTAKIAYPESKTPAPTP